VFLIIEQTPELPDSNDDPPPRLPDEPPPGKSLGSETLQGIEDLQSQNNQGTVAASFEPGKSNMKSLN